MKYIRIIILLFIAAAAVAFFMLTSDTDAQTLLFERIESWERHHTGLVLLIAVLTLVSTIAGLPVLYFGVALGFLLGFVPALAFTWGINLLAVMVTYLLVKHAFSASFRQRFGDKKLVQKINRRVRKHGLWSVAFARAVYVIPTNIINFSFPLSKVRPRSYLLGTMIGLVPESFINVFTGYLLKHEVILLNSPEAQLWKIIAVGAFLLLLAALFLFLRYRRQNLLD